jgi:hypothetical protein
MSVKTTTSPQTYGIKIVVGITPNITIVWGDGATSNNVATLGVCNHSYATAGTYTQQVSGSFASGGQITLYEGTPTLLLTTSEIGGITGLANFQNTFRGCTGLTSVPTNLFRFNPQVAVSAFLYTFYGDRGITSVPATLFKWNTNASNQAFESVLRDTRITTIPVDLFRYNTKVSVGAFHMAFGENSALTSVPADLFRYNTLVSTLGFKYTFLDCTALTTIPSDLFAYNTACDSFKGTFAGCNKLTMQSGIFGANLETRFSGKTIDFTTFFDLGTFTGTQGTYPALWSVSDTSHFTITDCYDGATTGSASNYADIPAGWK